MSLLTPHRGRCTLYVASVDHFKVDSELPTENPMTQVIASSDGLYRKYFFITLDI